MKDYALADLFCGAGGTSTGAMQAVEDAGMKPSLLAVNHWERAIETHTLNHPEHRHLCQNIEQIRPREYFRPKGAPKAGSKLPVLNGLWASPECTHHSVALGGRPVNDQKRCTAWNVTNWAEQLRPDFVWVENVPEFQNWGPIGSNNQPLKSGKGKIFHAWLATLRGIGYKVDYRVLRAADYGDPTTRQRLFVVAALGNRKIVWPDPTHAKVPDPDDMFEKREPWRTARDSVIDWSIEGTPLEERKRPLADKTHERIINGLFRHGLNPTVVGIDNGSGMHVRGVDSPLSTITTKQRHALVKPYLVKFRHNCGAESLDVPVSTVTCSGAHHGLVEPYLIPQMRRTPDRSVDLPLSTVTTTTRGYGLCEPYLVKVNHGGDSDRSMSLDKPMGTVTCKNGTALIQPYLVKFYGADKHGQPITEPLDTVTTKGRFALVVPTLNEKQPDIFEISFKFRMLAAHELAAAQGFMPDYQFAGNKSEIVKQIGNAVPRRLARAIVRASITQTP